MTEDEMAGWHHQLDGHEFEPALGVGDGQGSLVCCSPWGRKESDTAERLHFPFSFPDMCSRDICSLQSQIEDKDIQCTVFSVKPSGLP